MPTHRKGPPTPQLIEEYQAGATTPELGAKYGMHHSAVQGRLKRAGVALRAARARALFDEVDRTDAAVRMYTHDGLSIATIAQKLGTSRSTVQRALSTRGVATRPNGLRDATITVPTDTAVLAYMAGLFDGEGNLQFKERHGTLGCKMAVYSTTSDVMNWVRGRFGGSLRWDSSRTKKYGHKPIGIWELYRAQDVGRLLAALLPYLIIKRAAALKALRLFERRLHLTFASADDPADAAG